MRYNYDFLLIEKHLKPEKLPVPLSRIINYCY